MFAVDIGNSNIEEINIVREGGNYGWMRREGIFENGLHVAGGNGNQVYELPADILNGTTKDGFTYPVAIYDHGEGLAITAGFRTTGRVPALRGKFVFGDIARGRAVRGGRRRAQGRRRRHSPHRRADRGDPVVRSRCERKTDRRLAPGACRKADGRKLARTDLQISRQAATESCTSLTRQDGMIRTLVPDSGPATR